MWVKNNILWHHNKIVIQDIILFKIKLYFSKQTLLYLNPNKNFIYTMKMKPKKGQLYIYKNIL